MGHARVLFTFASKVSYAKRCASRVRSQPEQAQFCAVEPGLVDSQPVERRLAYQAAPVKANAVVTAATTPARTPALLADESGASSGSERKSESTAMPPTGALAPNVRNTTVLELGRTVLRICKPPHLLVVLDSM